MLKVLLISHTCQSATEGQPKALSLARRHPDLDFRVLIPTRWKHYGKWRTPDLPSAGSPLRLISARPRFPWVGPAQNYLHYYPGLKRLLLDFKPDVIDLWEEPWGLVSAHACHLRNRFLPATRVISETEQNIDKRLPFPFESCRAYTLRNADRAVARSHGAAQVLRDKGYAGPIDVVPNAVDAELFRPMNRDDCRREFSLDGFVVGYVGRLVPEKGLADLIDALPLLPPHVSVLLVGEGDYSQALRERARLLNVDSRVRFIGAKPLTELPRIMNAIDALALPSRTTTRWKEQFGRVLIEAMACQTPVLGSDSGAIPDVVADAGLTFAEANPPALAAAILTLATSPDQARAQGLRGRALVESLYTWDQVADRMATLYRTTVRSPASLFPAPREREGLSPL